MKSVLAELTEWLSGGRTDDAEGGWITINGAHIPIGENGELQGSVGSKISSSSSGKGSSKYGGLDITKVGGAGDDGYEPVTAKINGKKVKSFQTNIFKNKKTGECLLGHQYMVPGKRIGPSGIQVRMHDKDGNLVKKISGTTAFGSQYECITKGDL